ncbi:MAG TPA: DUF502 domain-containing protein [Gammaproteobacteria bacterium]|jgi:uncharacterized membrane protein|nr:DUF502 domain-containing protein [Gammaproteobacteria bacterium]
MNLDPLRKRSLMVRLRRYLLTGLVIWIPLGVTLFIFQLFIGYMDRLVLLFPRAWQPMQLIGFNLPGLGVILALLILLLTGFIASNYLGRTLLRWGGEILEHIPLVRSVYTSVRQISDTMFSNKGRSFRKVVLIRYPQKDTWSLAFQTSESLGELNKKLPEHMVSVFVPTTPNPTSGFLLMVPQEDMIELEMTVDEALKMILSLGVIVPPWPRPQESKSDPDPTGGDTVPQLAEPPRRL